MEDLTALPHNNHAPTGSGRFFCSGKTSWDTGD